MIMIIMTMTMIMILILILMLILILTLLGIYIVKIPTNYAEDHFPLVSREKKIEVFISQ